VYFSPKLPLAFNGPHCFIFQKIDIFMSTTARTSKPYVFL
jgi:hypothetical protein